MFRLQLTTILYYFSYRFCVVQQSSLIKTDKEKPPTTTTKTHPRKFGEAMDAFYTLGVTVSWGCIPNTLNVFNVALAGVAQWIKYRPVNQRVASLIPGQGTGLGCGPGTRWGSV